jgi:uncharacterized membrane protein (UPF0127 family)
MLGLKTLRTLALFPVATLLLAAAGAGIMAGTTPDHGSPTEPIALFPDGHSFRLEIARTPEERARGYMFRERVGRDEGMLFLFPQEDFHSFWMKNCRVSLDLIWLSRDRNVVHIEREVPPCRHDPCPGYLPMQKARYVLEVAAGEAARSRLKMGDPVRIEGVDFGAPIPP